jgi:hypothetical protein
MKSLRDDVHITRSIHHIHTMRYSPHAAALDARPFHGYTIVQVARLNRLKYRHAQQNALNHSDVADASLPFPPRPTPHPRATPAIARRRIRSACVRMPRAVQLSTSGAIRSLCDLGCFRTLESARTIVRKR